MTMTERRARVVLALASANMKLADTSRDLGINPKTLTARLDDIEKATGLNPRKFYDLQKLVKMVSEKETDEKEQNNMSKNLYRGKSKETGAWVVGDLMHDYYTMQDTCIGGLEGVCPVDPETVGQFTALPHPERIFEGDVLQHEAEKIRGAVIYSERDAAFALKTPDGELYDFVDFPAHEMTKLGNVHDDPELMGA